MQTALRIKFEAAEINSLFFPLVKATGMKHAALGYECINASVLLYNCVRLCETFRLALSLSLHNQNHRITERLRL